MHQTLRTFVLLIVIVILLSGCSNLFTGTQSTPEQSSSAETPTEETPSEEPKEVAPAPLPDGGEEVPLDGGDGDGGTINIGDDGGDGTFLDGGDGVIGGGDDAEIGAGPLPGDDFGDFPDFGDLFGGL